MSDSDPYTPEHPRLSSFYQRTVIVLLILFCAGAAFMIWQASLSHSRVVHSVALNEASHYSKLLSEFRALYASEVVAPAAAHGLEVTHDYRSKEGAIPLPATLSILLAERITDMREGDGFRLYSDYPFPWRDDGGPRDSFEIEALSRLRQNPDEPFYRFEESGGRDVLRYATADVMARACVSCHNSHPRSPKRDWKVGDVRGVLEITLPMDAAVARAGADLRGTLVLVGGAGLFGLLGIAVVVRKLQNISTDLEMGIQQRTVELHEARDRERKREQQMRLAVEAAPNGMVMINGQGTIVLVNTKIEEMFGYDRDELLGESMEILVPERFRAEHPEHRRRFFAAPAARPMGTGRDLFAMRRDGSEFPVELGLNPLETENGMMVLAAVVDITHRKRVEQQIADALDELKRKNRELDEFSYVASHDLQEPVRKLISFSKLLEQDLGDDLNEQAAKDLKFIVDAASRMRDLVQALLALSRVGRNAMRRDLVSLDNCVNRAIDSLELRIQETSAQVTRDPLPDVTGDETMLTQLYQNLISNALKFIADSQPKIHLTAHRDGEQWILGVQDNGIGMKAEYCERIFQPFQRLHGRGEYPGTGIGLSICKKTVERHGGTIWVESTPGEGSHFKFTIQARSATEPLDATDEIENTCRPGHRSQLSTLAATP